MLRTFYRGSAAEGMASAGPISTFLISSEAFDATVAPPIRPGWRELRDRMQEREADPAHRQRLADARRRLAHLLSEPGSLPFLRLEQGWSTRDLAAMSSTSEVVLLHLETGIDADPRLSLCRRLAQALDRSLDEIAAAIEISGRKDPGYQVDRRGP